MNGKANPKGREGVAAPSRSAPEYAKPDRLFGAAAIAEAVYGDSSKAKKVYNMVQRVRPPHRFPVYKLNGELVALRSEIEAWFRQEGQL